MRIAAYCRVSTEEQAMHGLSIDAQLAALDAWGGEQIVDHYVDRGVSGRTPIKKRPELMRLLGDVQAGKIDLVAFTKLDRWTRNIREYYKAQDVLDAAGVAWKALHEEYETQTAAGRLKVNIMLSVAQDEADRTSERVKSVFSDMRRRGLEVGSHMPLGLTYDKGRMVVNEDADRVRALFNAYIAGRSVNKLSAMSEHILGKVVSPRSVGQMLTNERYLKSGLIDPATWDAVQRIAAERATRFVRTVRIYLFAGLLVCPECGYKLTSRCHVEKGREYIYYRCDRYDRVQRCGWRHSVNEPKAERWLLEHLLGAVAEYNLRAEAKKQKPPDTAAMQRKLDRLTDLYISEAIDREEYDRRAVPLRDALRTAQAQAAAKPADLEQVRTALAAYDGLSREARKAFWSASIKRITPAADGAGFTLELVLP